MMLTPHFLSFNLLSGEGLFKKRKKEKTLSNIDGKTASDAFTQAKSCKICCIFLKINYYMLGLYDCHTL